MQTAFLKLSEVTRKKTAMMRTCYMDFMKSVATSMNPAKYEEVGKQFMVSFVRAVTCFGLNPFSVFLSTKGGDGKVKKPP
jgi:hypothetical protein